MFCALEWLLATPFGPCREVIERRQNVASLVGTVSSTAPDLSQNAIFYESVNSVLDVPGIDTQLAGARFASITGWR